MNLENALAGFALFWLLMIGLEVLMIPIIMLIYDIHKHSDSD
jgi:hypothetical protein